MALADPVDAALARRGVVAPAAVFDHSPRGGPMASYANTAALIASIESNGNPHAMRFEPRVYRPVLASWVVASIAAMNGCDNQTARVIYATSFGLYQIMGFNLYSVCDCKTDVFAFVDDADAQTDAFHAYLKSRKINFSVDELRNPDIALRFAMAYNGSAAYAKLIAEKLK